jgi:hypothetical protein
VNCLLGCIFTWSGSSSYVITLYNLLSRVGLVGAFAQGNVSCSRSVYLSLGTAQFAVIQTKMTLTLCRHISVNLMLKLSNKNFVFGLFQML